MIINNLRLLQRPRVAGETGVKYSDTSGRITEEMVVFCRQNYWQSICKKGLRELLQSVFVFVRSIRVKPRFPVNSLDELQFSETRDL
jgi:hypothetical protein